MNTKVIYTVITAILLAGIFITVVCAKGFNFLCAKNNILVTLKNDVDMNKAKITITKIPQIKIIKTTYRDKEWSKMVNKYDLPKMENPFKNEFVIKINKKANIDEILNKIKEMSFVEDVKYMPDTKECQMNKN